MVAVPLFLLQEPVPRLTPEQYREDLVAFRGFLATDKSYATASRAQAEQRLTVLERALDTVGLPWFEIELTRLVALADNGHTNAQAAARSARFNRIPLRLTPLGGGFFVLRAHGAYADLLGARLVAIDGRPVADLRRMVHTLTGGAEGWRDRFAPYALESPQQLRLLSGTGEANSGTYRFALANGRTVDRRIVADPADATRPRNGTARWMYPDVALPNEGDGWRSLLTADRAPWALQDITTPFRWRDAPELQALVIELRQNTNAQGHPIAAFLTEVEGELQRRQPRNVVLDMRINGGGDLNTTRDFMKKLPSLVPGRVFVLTSPYTFSAAISSVGYLEQSAPERVTIVGEGVGDRLEFWAEGAPVTLSGSGMVIGRAKERHDYLNGCKTYTDCHGSVVRNPISVKSLAPGIAAPWTIEAYRAGRDPGMEAVAAALR